MADGEVFGDREHFWRDHIASWKSSGLSLRLYSERHGLKAGTLGDVPLDVANGQALLINDYAASPVQARAPSLVVGAEGAA